jgi:diguanylate cyclase (GGDEF)-like protein
MLKHFLKFLVPTLSLLCVGYGLLLFNQAFTLKKAYINTGKFHTQLMEQAIQDGLNNIYLDLQNLYDSRQFTQYINKPGPTRKMATENRFLSFMNDRPFYDQVRYINAKGQEVIRIDNQENGPIVIKKDQLQNKALRYYFREAIQLNEGALYQSVLDLNVENGDIETPFKPMLRLALATFNEAKEKTGILILNYRAANLLNRLDAFKTDNNIRVWMLNQNGYWLKHHDPSQEWGFLLNTAHNFFDEHGETAKQVFAQSSGNFSNADGLYSFKTIYPKRLILNFSEINSVNRFWKIIEFVPANHYSFLSVVKNSNDTFWVFLILCSLSSIGCWYLAKFQLQYQQSVEKLQVAATHDELTGLPNRKLLEDRSELAIASAKRNKTKIGILYIDLNGFKPVNDQLGHAIGDLALIEVAKRLNESVRQTDTVARLGGDEFIVMTGPVHSLDEVKVVAEKVQDCLKQPYELGSETVNIGASIGVGLYPDHGDFLDHVIREADKAMYQAKKMGHTAITYVIEKGHPRI